MPKICAIQETGKLQILQKLQLLQDYIKTVKIVSTYQETMEEYVATLQEQLVSAVKSLIIMYIWVANTKMMKSL